MKKATDFRATLAITLLALAALACHKGDDEGAIVDDFIPEISNAWEDGATGNVYILSADSADVPAGTFTGTRQHPDSADIPELSGSFVHERIQFTFTSGHPQGITYKGVIDTVHPNRMRLAAVPGGDSLHLEHP